MWADKNNIDVVQPETLEENGIKELLENSEWDFFVVVAYGKIFPEWILNIPQYGVLNVHPSLLPKLRGPSPIETSIIQDEKKTGVSIILLDSKTDHGPILAQASVDIENWPPKASVLEDILAKEGGKLLAEVIPLLCSKKIEAEEQNHEEATFTKKLLKEDGLIDLNDDPYKNFLKIRAYDTWPGTFFFVDKNNKKIRIKIVDAEFKNGELLITSVIPEGKKEISYQDFLRN